MKGIIDILESNLCLETLRVHEDLEGIMTVVCLKGHIGDIVIL
jgi:hypothetical protein